jgi:hypothetical protein
VQQFKKYVKAAKDNNKEKDRNKRGIKKKKKKERQGSLKKKNKEMWTKEKFIGLVQIAFPIIRVIYNGL